jgi:hypothetical protein
MCMATHHMQTFLFFASLVEIKAQSHRFRAKGSSSSLQRCYTEAHPSHKLHFVYEATCRLHLSTVCTSMGMEYQSVRFDRAASYLQIDGEIYLLGTRHNPRCVHYDGYNELHVCLSPKPPTGVSSHDKCSDGTLLYT